MITLIYEDQQPLFEMSKLIKDYADESICGDFGKFIYFSPSLDSHGPRVKFYGGTKETSTTKNAPSLAFTNTGETEIRLANWMDKKNCPNAFDKDYVKKVEEFVKRLLPILLLVWYGKLDEGHALKFFEGSLTLKKLLSYVEDLEEENLEMIRNAKNLKQLHNLCLNKELYKF